MGTYNYTHIMEYLPTRYSATPEQRSERQAVWNFKDGYCSSTIKQQIKEKILLIKRTFSFGSCRVCFIPASSHLKTIRRYRDLCRYIENETGCACSIDTITSDHDTEAGHIYGKQRNPAENYNIDRNDVRGKNIILIDDVITRGNTFVYTADKLIENGAANVVGLFVAKTINPDRAYNCA